MKSLRVATSNINGIRFRLSKLLASSQEASPDVVCLQELKTDAASFPIADIEAAGNAALRQAGSTLITPAPYVGWKIKSGSRQRSRLTNTVQAIDTAKRLAQQRQVRPTA